MNPKRGPSQPPQKGRVSKQKKHLDRFSDRSSSSTLGRLGGAFHFFLCFFLIPAFFSYSQTSKETPSIFILQGTVKLKGKPVEGVSLELLKNEKQISKIITRKNGMYSFQMNTSNTDLETEYILNIKKEGTTPGLLKVNTFNANEEFNYVPYIFNLEINLTLPVASDDIVKHDFGKIKWNPEHGVFDFDKEYVSMVEKGADSIKTDSNNIPLAVIDKINMMAEEIKITADEQAMQKTDDLKTQKLINEKLAKTSTLKESSQTDDLKTPELVNENLAKVTTVKETEKEDDLKTQESVYENSAKVSTMKETEKKDVNISANEQRDIVSYKKKLETGNKKPNQSESLNQKSPSSNLNTAASVLQKKTNEIAALKTKENLSKISNLKVSNIDIENKKQLNANNIKLETNNKQLAIDNEQHSANPTSVDINPTTFDGTSLFSTNNQKNRLLEDKNKMERKKTENLAKKYETSNILTSLLDVVEEFETHPGPPQGREN